MCIHFCFQQEKEKIATKQCEKQTYSVNELDKMICALQSNIENKNK